MVTTTTNPKQITKITGTLLERLNNGVVLGAEGYLFELERRGYIKAGAYVPEVVLDNPNALRELHREFVNAGSEVIEAFTYYAHRDKLRLIGRENDLEPLNRQALKIAKEIAQEFKEQKDLDLLVAGNICNTWVYDHNDPERTGQIVREMYEEQVGWAKEANVDFVIAETLGYVGEALIALDVIKKHGLPSVITLAVLGEKTHDGYDWVEACQLLEKNGADVVGFNCHLGPQTMLPLLKRLRSSVNCYIAAQPVPYRTTVDEPSFVALTDKQQSGLNLFPLGLEQHQCTRFEMAEFARDAKALGVNYVGVCCGGAPYQVREMAEALGRVTPSSQYTADLSKHGMLGSSDVVKKHQVEFASQWRVSNKNA